MLSANPKSAWYFLGTRTFDGATLARSFNATPPAYSTARLVEAVIQPML
jgi:hypothetical protein